MWRVWGLQLKTEMLEGSMAVELTPLTLNLLKQDSKFITLIQPVFVFRVRCSKVLVSDYLSKDS